LEARVACSDAKGPVIVDCNVRTFTARIYAFMNAINVCVPKSCSIRFKL
jgi:hypothetical protein